MTHFDQLALYRPGLLSAERIILPDAFEEAALRLGGADLALAVDLLMQNRYTDRLDNIRRDMARFVRFVREHFALIQAGFILFTSSESVRQEQQSKGGFTDENAGRSFLSSVMPQLPWDRAAVDAATEIKVALRLAGTPSGPNDTAIAGLAFAAGAILMTNNVREFERVPSLMLEDWVK